jgi:DNA-binding transcriptional ArsR family regulator
MEAMTALADPVRRQIVERLSTGERTAGELGEGFGISQPAVSRHLRVLREAGLVVARAEAQRRVYRLDPKPLREIDLWLDRYRVFWKESLDRLQAYIAEEANAPERVLKRQPPRRYIGRREYHCRYTVVRLN